MKASLNGLLETRVRAFKARLPDAPPAGPRATVRSARRGEGQVWPVRDRAIPNYSMKLRHGEGQALALRVKDARRLARDRPSRCG